MRAELLTSRARPRLVVVAAVADNGVIGRNGTLPWRLRSDMRHFRALTMGHPVVMGRTTFGSIGRPLPGRTTVVVTRDRGFAAGGVVAAPDLTTALAVARADALRRSVDAVMLAGGGMLYAEAMPLADRLVITWVHATPAGDVGFPPIDPAVWQEIERTPGVAGPDDDAPFTICRYERITSAAASDRRGGAR